MSNPEMCLHWISIRGCERSWRNCIVTCILERYVQSNNTLQILDAFSSVHKRGEGRLTSVSQDFAPIEILDDVCDLITKGLMHTCPSCGQSCTYEETNIKEDEAPSSSMVRPIHFAHYYVLDGGLDFSFFFATFSCRLTSVRVSSRQDRNEARPSHTAGAVRNRREMRRSRYCCELCLIPTSQTDHQWRCCR